MKKLFTFMLFLCAALTASADWYVTGDPGLTDLNWQVDGQKMTETFSGSGIYTTQFTVTTAGTYGFKVTDGTWTTAYPGTDLGTEYKVTTSADNVTLTIKFDAVTHTIATTENSGAHQTYVLVQSDVQPNLYVYSMSGETAVYQNGAWPGQQMEAVEINGETFYKAGPFENFFDPSWTLGLIISNNNGSNETTTIWKNGNDGAYACEYNSTNGSYVELPTLRGQIPTNDWTIGLPLSYDSSSNTYTATATPAWAGALYKIVWFGDGDWPTWYGWGSEESNVTTNDDYTLSTSGNNMQIRLARPVTFTLNTSTMVLNVNTDDNDLSLDYFTTYGNATYDPTTSYDVTTTTNEWHGISIDLGNSSTLSAPYLVVTKSDTDQQLYINVKDTDGNKINDKVFDATSTVCILPLDDTKCIKEVELKNPAAGTLKLTDCYATSAATIAAPAEAISGTQYLTYGNLDHAVSFAGIEGIEVSTVTYDAAVGCTRKHDVASKAVPAKTAVVLFKEAGFTEALTLPVLKEAAALGDNDLKVSDGSVQGAANIFCLSNGAKGIGFYPVAAGVQVPANKAYLDLSNSPLAPKFIGFPDETTGIDALENGEATAEKAGAIYTLDGRRVNGNLSHGLYIQNGKKFVVK